MKRTIVFAASIVVCAVWTVYADYSVTNIGTWPKTWPEELEPLRKQSRTLEGPLVPQLQYEIPFTKREDFESAWPHLLKVKSKGAPLILLRGPDTKLGRINAGVRIHCPPPQTGDRGMPEAPLPGSTNDRGRWIWTTYIDLVVDGDIIDLNRIPLPADTPIIVVRFEVGHRKAVNRSGG